MSRASLIGHYPSVSFGAGWSQTGTPTISVAATTINGIPLDLVGDDDGGSSEQVSKTITLVGDGGKTISFLVKKSSSYATHQIGLYDSTIGYYRVLATINFTAATPTVTASTSYAGLVLSTTAEGTGYRVTLTAQGCVAANTNQLIILPAGGAAADTASFYIGDIRVWNDGARVRTRGWSVATPALDNRNVAAWSSVGTPVRTAAASVGNGCPLDLLSDDSGAALEGYTKAVTFTGNDVKILSCLVSKGSSTSSVIRLRDTSAPANRLLAVVTWSGTVPSIVMTTGTNLSSTLVDSVTNTYRLVFATTSVTAANVNQYEVYPATDAALATANTGTVYLGDFQAWDIDGDPVLYDSGYTSIGPAAQTVEDYSQLNVPYVAYPGNATARYWRIDIDDIGNTAGVVDLGRLIIAGAYTPTVNMSYGAALGLEDDTTRHVTDGGAALYNARSKRRSVTGVLDNMADAEALGTFWKMQKQLGTSGQFFFMWDSADTTYKHDRAFLACFRQLSALEAPYVSRNRAAFSLVEEI
jgi:hypothetical protein